MAFQVGDSVIHCAFGLGEITHIEERIINGELMNCYAVRIVDMTVWVPMDDSSQKSLRIVTPPEEFVKTLPILTSPSEVLVEDRVLRKNQLMEQLKDGQLASICRVVRDLTHYRRNSKLNEQEKYILDKAVKSLITEWTLSMGTTHHQAYQAMESMLQS